MRAPMRPSALQFISEWLIVRWKLKLSSKFSFTLIAIQNCRRSVVDEIECFWVDFIGEALSDVFGEPTTANGRSHERITIVLTDVERFVNDFVQPVVLLQN